MCEPLVKKQKLEEKKVKHTTRKRYLEVGQKGFFATCNFNEKDCVRESYNLLNQCANELYGPEEKGGRGASEDKEEDKDDDIVDKLEKQINASRIKKSDCERRFQAVDTGAKNCVFIKTTLDDPIKIAKHIVRDIFETERQKTRHLLRLVPIEAVCKANNIDIVRTAGQLCDKYFLKGSTTFSIVFNKRFNNDLKRDQLIHQLAELIHDKNVRNKVDLKHAKKSLVVEVIKGFCCLTVVEDYMAMKRYNLIELSTAKRKAKSSSEAISTREKVPYVDKTIGCADSTCLEEEDSDVEIISD